MSFLTKAAGLLGSAFNLANAALDKVFLGDEGIRSVTAAHRFEELNYISQKYGLGIIVKEKGQGIDRLPETTMRVVIDAPAKKAGFHNRRLIAVDIDMSCSSTTETGMKALTKRFYEIAAEVKPSFVPPVTAEGGPH